MAQRSEEARAVRTIGVLCLALAFAVVVPAALFVLGWPELGMILFLGLLLLWPVLALFSAWALRRGDR